ncbi:glycosyl transferase [Paenibacillus sp. 598K]|uniref:tetratricopeptide repeat-containing glycosyltransferase family 2 protein n=1 Tax=Paenibacillus sp. 598K TaxID=1117987 RepID=UPI000FFB05E5|nr:glycosyltransferase [Paenibacillus sp. 598K]GBF74544.1 glycosyl transferase [Paenibacillus sp. 598K]
MISISLCMIVKNEEAVLARCLESVGAVADEIVIVDTGSTDRTVEIARQFTDRIFHFDWIDDFAAARNYAFAQASQPYILWLDADDILLQQDQQKLLELKSSLDPEVDSVSMLYNLSTDEFGNVSFSLRRNRLVKRSRGFRWIGPVHEYLEVGGHIISSDIAVTHAPGAEDGDSDRNLRIYEKRQAAGERFNARDLYYYANELKDHRRYVEASRMYEQFLNSGEGWVEDEITACGKLADCYLEVGNRKLALEAALRSFQYGSPRAEACCRIGYHYLEQDDASAAVAWYRFATQLPQPDTWGFANPACSTWLPHLQLCVCYDRLGQYDLAHEHNEQALLYRPSDTRMLANRKYLATRLTTVSATTTKEAIRDEH